MNISFFAYALSTILGLFFVYRIKRTLRKNSTDFSKDFLAFFFFGSIYFLVRALSLLFLSQNLTLLAYAYPVSHIFLYLSFSFMLKTAFELTRLKNYSNLFFTTSLVLAVFILTMNFVYINKPVFEGALVDWGTKGIVGIFHLLYALIAIVAISSIFISQAFKKKKLDKNCLLIGLGFAFLPLSILKHFFPTELLFIFEFNMIFGITIVAIGLSLNKKVKV
jgi:hypothetical protein